MTGSTCIALYGWRSNLWRAKPEGKGPYYAGSVEFSPGMAHGGAVAIPPPIPAQSFNERVMLAFAEWIRESAPAGADLKSWQ